MLIRRTLGSLVGLAPLVLLAAPVPANATSTLDQSQTKYSGADAVVISSRQIAQTFTAGITGSLDQVKLFISLAVAPPVVGDLTVQIQTAAGGMPSGVVLASATVPAGSVSPSTDGWVSVPLSPAAPSSAGTQYAIVLSSPTTSCRGACFYRWGVGTGNPYAGGTDLVSSDGGLSWAPESVFNDDDQVFQTFVTPPLPTSKDQCKDGGWKTYGGTFKNQGDCVSFVATHGNNTAG